MSIGQLQFLEITFVHNIIVEPILTSASHLIGIILNRLGFQKGAEKRRDVCPDEIQDEGEAAASRVRLHLHRFSG